MRTLALVLIGLMLAGTAGARGGPADSTWEGYRSHLVAQSDNPELQHSSNGPGSRLDLMATTSFNSGVCDSLADATPGLRLMCVAFCEIQTCVPDFTLDDPFESCSKSSQWILSRYEARRGPGDPDMPCLQQPDTVAECPCWSRDELAGYRYPVSGDRPSCFLNLNSATAGISNMDSWRIFSSDGQSYVTALTSTGTDSDGVSSCQATDQVCDPLTGQCTTTSRYFALTPEQLAACEADVAVSAADRGLTCREL